VSGAGEVPYRFGPPAPAAEVAAAHAGLAPGEGSGRRATVAGRLMLRRVQGRLAFATLADASGRVQLFATAGGTPGYEAFCALAVGDWVGVSGEVVRTRRGEVSVMVEDWAVLARTRRPFPDKWHGLADPDTRYRQRYVDLWVTEGARRALLLRSRMVSALRRFLEDRGFVEVETPVLHAVAGGAAARPFVTHHNALDADLYLRVATELHLKRLVVGGFEKVFEVGRTFRNEGLSPRHNPEFTTVELYQAYADYHDMMALTEELVAHLALALLGTTAVAYGGRGLELAPPWRRATMVELVAEHAGIEVDVAMPLGELRARAAAAGVEPDPAWGPGRLVLEVYEKTTEAALWGPVFVCDYPVEVSPLARQHRSSPGLVERFEAIVAGRELANAFSELADPAVQRERFADQARARAAGDEEAMALDEDFLRALEYGLPPTGGLGIGVDRLAMILADAHHIRDVLAFPSLRPEP